MRKNAVNYMSFIGVKFGRLVAIDFLGKKNTSTKRYYKCKCECGKETEVSYYHLINGHTKSCGCMAKPYKGLNKRVYVIWNSMMQRCYNPKSVSYHNYGSKGISVCDEWQQSFKSFYDWALGNGYEDTLTLDRRSNKEGYSPLNCRWVTVKNQQNNKTSNVFITHNGITLTIQQWSEKTGIGSSLISYRNKNGWGGDDLFKIPECKNKATNKIY